MIEIPGVYKVILSKCDDEIGNKIESTLKSITLFFTITNSSAEKIWIEEGKLPSYIQKRCDYNLLKIAKGVANGKNTLIDFSRAVYDVECTYATS